MNIETKNIIGIGESGEDNFELSDTPIPGYHITITESEDRQIIARQINNEVGLPADVNSLAIGLLEQKEVRQVNIHINEHSATHQAEVLINPVNLVFFSSIGAMYVAEMNVRQPSDGMWALAEILARENPEVSCLCIDPNILPYEEILNKLKKLGIDPGNTIFGISSLVQNTPNEAEFINKLQNDFRDIKILIGGIGVDTLKLLPNPEGNFGIESQDNNIIVIPGLSVFETQAIVRQVYEHPDSNIQDMRNTVRQISETYTAENWQSVITKLQIAREKSRLYFIPLKSDRKRLFYDDSYEEMRSGHQIEMAVTDNRCTYKCWFCSTPKDARYTTKEDEFNFIKVVASNAPEFAFNNNDLATYPEKTIWLCDKMAQDQELDIPKHGKMSAAVYNPELLDALARAGFVRIAIGVETFDLSHRKQLKGGKFDNPSAVQETIQHLLDLGITPEINLILFHPRETEKSLVTTSEESLFWINKGAIVNATLGVNAIPNSYAVRKILENMAVKGRADIDKLQQLFELQEIPDVFNKTVLIPVQWKTEDPEIQRIKFEVREKRLSIINSLPEDLQKITKANYVPIESYIALKLILSEIKGDNLAIGEVKEYIQTFKNRVYVGI